jgi:hypothetical protein
MKAELVQRFQSAMKGRKPDDMLVIFRHYKAGEPTDGPFEPHEDHLFLTVHFDDLEEAMTRCNREFGDPLKDLGGPVLPPLEERARR